MKSLSTLAALAIGFGPLAAAPVAITNFNMESAPTARSDGAITSTLATGWTHTNLSGATGVFTFNTTTTTRYYNEADFADTQPSGGAHGTMAGPNFAGLSGDGSGRIDQTLAATLAASTQYTLAVALGHRTVDSGAAATASTVTLELLAGGVSLGTIVANPAAGVWDDSGTNPDDTWADSSLVFVSGANPAQLGQAITIRFTKSGAGGNYMDLDNVRLDATPVVTPPAVDLNQGLVAYFPFETDAANRAGATDGTLRSGALAGQPGGQVGNALSLRSTGGSANEHLNVAIGFGGAPSDTNLGNNFTISTWYQLDQPPSGSASGRYFVFEGDGSTGQGFEVSYGLRDLSLGTPGLNDGQIFTDTTTTSPAGANSLNRADAATAGWHHVLQTYSSNGTVTTITTYIDGVAAGTLTPQTSAMIDGGLNFGAARSAVLDRGFDGKIDEVALWTRVLNAEEIAGVRSLGLAGSPIANPPLISSFTASPETSSPGGQVTLSWSVSGAETVVISPGVGTVAASGSAVVSVSDPVTYTLAATGADGAQDRKSRAITVSKGPIHVFLLGGQSNMQGVGQKSKLVPLGLDSIPEVMLYHSTGTSSTGGANQWITVRANGFDSASFGPEIGFAEATRVLRSGERVALIKHAVGGTSLQVKWKPGASNADNANFGVEYATFVSTVNNAITALRAQGYQPVIDGMLWQQGEQDSKAGINTGGDGNATSAIDYGANLKHFVARVREQFAADISPQGLRFVLGQVTPYYPAGGTLETDYPARDTIRQAQLDADADSGAALSIVNTGTVPTNDVEFPVHEQELDGYRDTDEAHFNAAAQLRLGRRMAYEMFGLAPQSYLEWSDDFDLAGDADDDDDRDGSSNFLEFAAGSDPTDATSVIRPAAGFEVVSGAPFLTTSFPVNLNARGVAWQVEYSENLVAWNPGSGPVLLTASYPVPGIAHWKFRAPVGTAGHPAGFLRMAAKAVPELVP
ncbi:hypothetical protein OKA05_08135 [Luteolibacter arcticus]|uniref:LamG-like jellyroll fold domain-containing protein n=1 Tax=Luteolibacter arcticus TaxID=1581411 RepID=A0ABT3GGS2_9BACT|nr:sialate O-acetylesterase [Luteolibacter arcticus]MCW1922520.1 hypothetical protein [Luteolibacter arcticus]